MPGNVSHLLRASSTTDCNLWELFNTIFQCHRSCYFYILQIRKLHSQAVEELALSHTACLWQNQHSDSSLPDPQALLVHHFSRWAYCGAEAVSLRHSFMEHPFFSVENSIGLLTFFKIFFIYLFFLSHYAAFAGLKLTGPGWP